MTVCPTCDNRNNSNINDYDENKAKFKVSATSACNVNVIRKTQHK